MSVKVGVRVRPFNAREKDRESKCIIEMIQNQTRIHDDAGGEKTFTFDHSFWSHDGFETLESGYFKPVSDKYADQTHVFNAVGKEILDNAWEGYHCCLFAYGQTGSGKSYSMVGYGANKGIVPISCNEIFERIKANTDPEKSYEVQVSMLEIYNEKVQDLLVAANKRPNSGLKVRESKVLGIFVEGLTKYPVTSYDEISKKMDEGYENRTIGSTLMNATSSRAHTIVTIEFKQLTMIAGKKSEKLSMINLVDLAGSERAGSTGATGDRLKEGCNINKSLLVLGNVINALADKALGKKTALPPYRDSALTRILQNALGGNSKTVMICALSPASINYEETLSTLRYADRAKKIQNKAVVNESEHDKMVRLLKEENGELKKMIEDLQKKLLGQGGVVGDDDKKAFLELKEQYEANQKVMVDMEKTFEERIKEAKEIEKATIGLRVDPSKPHLVVLNEDPQLSHKLRYALVNLPVYVGRKDGNPPPQITLAGIGIKPNHAVFIKEGDNIVLKPNHKEAKEHIYINGKRIEKEEGQVIQRKDRIVFGHNSIFIYLPDSDGKDLYEVDWETAECELQTALEKYNEEQMKENEKRQQEEITMLKQNFDEEFAKKEQQMKDQFQKELEEYHDALKRQNQNEEKERIEQGRRMHEQLLKKKFAMLQEEKARKKKELERREKEELYKKDSAIKEKDLLQKSKKLESNLFNILKKINKMKIIITELRRNIDLKAQLETTLDSKTNSIVPLNNIQIRVENYEEGTVYYWTPETFHNRYDLMKELFDRFTDEDLDLTNLSKEEDPLWDEPKPELLGFAFYKLEPVVYLMENPSESSIISLKGNPVGKISLNIIPVDENGNEFDEVPDEPIDLIGQNLLYKVVISKCYDLYENFCSNLYVEYTLELDGTKNKTKVYNTDLNNLQNSIEINESFEHSISYLTKEDINFFVNGILKFEIYAFEQVEKKGKIKSQQNAKNGDGDNNDVVKIDGQQKPEVEKLVIVEEYFDQNKGENKTEKVNNEANKVDENAEKDKSNNSKDKDDQKKHDKNDKNCMIY